MPQQITRQGVYYERTKFEEHHRALIIDNLPDMEEM